MSKHEPATMTIGQIINAIDERSSDPWYDVIGVKIPGLKEAINTIGEDEDWTAIDDIEASYIAEHRNDVYLVSWPDHVSCPRFNGDANYQPQ